MSFLGGGFPFDAFFGGGGRPDFGGQPREVDNNRYYELLGVPKTASTADIKKAYRTLARTEHPDKGGDPEKFADISNAYEVLSNDEKRQLYDRVGEQGLKEGAGQGGGHADLFDLLSGGGRRRGEERSERRAPDVQFTLKVSLEDLYNGKTSKIAINRDRVCDKCEGKGGSKVQTCGECRGKGMVTRLQQLGPGMYTQSTGRCSDCKGEGRIIEAGHRCKTCKGERVVKEKKVIQVEVDKGVPNHHKITYAGESDEAPGLLPGDLIVVIEEKEHPQFKRKKADLIMKKTLSLREALTGFSFTITHLDGNERLITSEPGAIIKPQDMKTVPELGMPIMRTPWKYGNLFIYFDVEFPAPSTFTPEQLQSLRAILPGDDMEIDTEQFEKHSVVNFEKHHVTENSTRIHQDYDDEEDDDDPRFKGARQVHCSGTIF